MGIVLVGLLQKRELREHRNGKASHESGKLTLLIWCPFHSHYWRLVRPEAMEGSCKTSPVPHLHTSVCCPCISIIRC